MKIFVPLIANALAQRGLSDRDGIKGIIPFFQNIIPLFNFFKRIMTLLTRHKLAAILLSVIRRFQGE